MWVSFTRFAPLSALLGRLLFGVSLPWDSSLHHLGSQNGDPEPMSTWSLGSLYPQTDSISAGLLWMVGQVGLCPRVPCQGDEWQLKSSAILSLSYIGQSKSHEQVFLLRVQKYLGIALKGIPWLKKKKFNLYKVVNENNFPHRHIPFNCDRLIPTMKWCIMLHSAVVSWLVYAFFIRDTWVVFSLSLYYR